MEVLFDTIPSIYWDDHIKIGHLQRRIIVHSISYYERNESYISDEQYDMLSQQLVRLQQSVEEREWKKSKYYYAMYDFDGSTGFDIIPRLNKEDRKMLDQIIKMLK